MSRSIGHHQTRKKEFFPYEILIPVGANENAVQLRDTTLKLCKAYRIPATKITVVLADKSQEGHFRSTLLPGSFSRLVTVHSAYELFSVGTPVVYMNSCITGIYEYSTDHVFQRKPLKSLIGLIKTGFEECGQADTHLWSILSLKTNCILKNKVSTKLKPISTVFWGCILTGIDSHLEFSEEIERSILYYKIDKKILRLNMFGVTSCKVSPPLSEKRMRELEGRFADFVEVFLKDTVFIIKVYDKRIKRVKPV
jgi:hypothetical protein